VTLVALGLQARVTCVVVTLVVTRLVGGWGRCNQHGNLVIGEIRDPPKSSLPIAVEVSGGPRQRRGLPVGNSSGLWNVPFPLPNKTATELLFWFVMGHV